MPENVTQITRVVEIPSGPLRKLEHGDEGFMGRFSADGCLLATPGLEAGIAIWAVRGSP